MSDKGKRSQLGASVGEENTNNSESNNKEYTVGGYNFTSKEAAREAKDELNAIKYMSAKTNSKDPAQIYVLYNKIIDKELFRTLVGINYLKQLQQFLYLNPNIPNEKIKPIPINEELSTAMKDRRGEILHKDELRSLKRESRRYKDFFIKSVIVNVVLVIAIGVIVYITVFSKNANVLNYETNLQNKYSSWQEQLESEEASLKAREADLNKR